MSKKEIQELGKTFRKQSIAYIGNKTISDMHKITNIAIDAQREIGFVGAVGPDKQIRLSALPVLKDATTGDAKIQSQIDKQYPTPEEQSQLFLWGHVHVAAYLHNETSPNDQHDYGFPSQNNANGGDFGNYLY